MGLPRPTVVATSTNQLERQLKALANAELRHTSTARNWPLLTREHSFAAVAANDQALPTDFRKILVDSVYDTDAYRSVRGSLSPGQWQQHMLYGNGPYRFRMRGNPNKFSLTPEPPVGTPFVFEYLIANFAMSLGGLGVAKPEYTLDTDSSIIYEPLVQLGLKWRIMAAKGLDYAEARNEWEAAVALRYADEIALPELRVGMARFDDDLPEPYVPENGFGA